MADPRYTLCRADFMLPFAEPDRSERIRDGYVLADGENIAEVGQWSRSVEERMATLGGSVRVLGAVPGGEAFPRIKGVLMPAFVKAHGHDHEPPLIGIAKDQPLTDWLDNAVNPFTRFINNNEEHLTEVLGCSPQLATYRMARVGDIHYGITACMVHHCNFSKYRFAEIAQANEAAGTTMIVAIGGQDRFYFAELLDQPADAIGRLDTAAELQNSCERTTFCPGPDQLFSNSRKVLIPLKAWAREHGTLFHIHSSEEPRTTAWFKAEIEPGFTPIEYAESIGILDEQTVVAHQVNNGPRDLEIMARTGTKVVHNPLANTILGSGMPPIIDMRTAGIPVAISTDGSGSADNQNIIAAARLASQYQKANLQDATVLTSQEVLEMVTVIPNRFLRMNQGELATGRQADWVVLSTARPNMVPTRLDNLTENVIWAADGSEIDWVVSRGRLLKADGELQTFLDGTTPKEIMDAVQTLSELYAEHQETADALKGTGAHGRED